jgi:glyceraldehyde-3-phosphate dehydrogenase (NADP+)
MGESAATKIFVGGEWVSTTTIQPVENPFTGDVIAQVYVAAEQEVDAAVTAAVTAFSTVRKQSAYDASTLLHNVVAGLKARKEDLVNTIVAEAGKPVSLAEVEVERSIVTFAIAAEEANRIGGEYLPLDITPGTVDRIGITRRFPIGVIVGITPFNFPLNLVAHKVAPALASRNCIIIKPAPQTPLTALLLAKILEEAGVVKGQVSVLPAQPAEAEKLVTDPRVALVSFTGSPKIGWHIKKIASHKKVALELGGNAAAVVCHDADLEWAVPRIAGGAFAYAGQVCISVQRILVHESCYKEFVQKLASYTEEKIKTGDPTDRSVLVGPMISKAALDRTMVWVTEAVADGAAILIGGKADGPCFAPTILSNVTPSMKVCCEEVFAPVAVVVPFATIEEAIAMVNDSAYGLQAGIFTHSVTTAFAAFEDLEVGGVIVNDFPTFRVDNMPYGGVKQSGFGREGIKYAIEEMTEIKVMVVKR